MIFAADCHNCLTTLLIAQPRPPTVSPPFTSRRISLSLSLASRHESLPPLWIGRRQALIISFTNLSFGDLKYRFQFLEVVGALSSVIKIDFLWILYVMMKYEHGVDFISYNMKMYEHDVDFISYNMRMYEYDVIFPCNGPLFNMYDKYVSDNCLLVVVMYPLEACVFFRIYQRFVFPLEFIKGCVFFGDSPEVCDFLRVCTKGKGKDAPTNDRRNP